MSIVLERLYKRYDGRPIVHAISLEVAPGELFVLLGPSGSGKSTVLRMIGGLTGADAGRILLGGRDVTSLAPQDRDVGFVFQHYALFGHMTVAENVEFGLRVRGVGASERRRRRDELLELVGLAGLGARLPRQLSGGQQQRVALARALATRPGVLLLDEPFGALDAQIRIEMRASLRRVQRELGITTIFVTHDQEEAFVLGDRLGLMNAGRLLEVGPPRELYLRPQTEFAATFLGTANILLGRADSRSIRLGPVAIPLRTEAADGAEADEPRPVQVLFRPEDVTLGAEGAALAGTPLGEATVEHTTFAGAYERLRLRLPALAGARSIAPAVPYGATTIAMEATRPLDEALRLPLAPGDRARVGVRRLHALAHPGMRFLLVLDGSRAEPDLLTLGADLARLAHARATVLGAASEKERIVAVLREGQQRLVGIPSLEKRLGHGTLAQAVASEAASEPYDLAVLSAEAAHAAGMLDAALDAGQQHILLAAPGQAAVPTKALVCLAGIEASKTDVDFAGRLFRHLGIEATLLTVLDDETEDGARSDPERAGQFLAAGVRSLGLLGVPATAAVRTGALLEVIRDAMTEGGHDLLVIGAPLRPLGSARIRPLLAADLGWPVLIVRSPYYANSTGTRLRAGAATEPEGILP